MSELKRYFSYMGKYKCAYWCNFIITLLVSAGIEILYSYMNKMVFNSVEYGDAKKFEMAVILCAVLVVINCLFPYFRYFQIKIVRKIVFDIKIKLFQKLMKMDMTYYEKTHSGEALKILNGDANSLKDSYFSHVYWVTGKVVNGITAIVAMIVYSPILAVISVIFSIITVQVSVRINRKIKEQEKGIQRSISQLTERLSDILSGFVILKMYRGSSIVLEHFQNENETVLCEEKHRAGRLGSLEMLSFLLGILGNFGTILAGAFLVAHGRMDYGTVMAVVSLQMNVSGMVQKFGSSMATLNASLVKAGRVFDFLEQDGEEVLDVEKVMDKKTLLWKSKINPLEIDNLTFGYDGKHKILEDFSLKVNSGEKILLTGESGCGKSTLLKLLMRFYEKSSGRIKVYGQDISDYSISQLRDFITYVPQNNYLFDGTIRDNIALGAGKTVTDEEIIRAAKLAYADEFIKELPDGYDTLLTAGGRNLSGGQRQRIAIARAFLKDSPILLLDEPSSALDVQSEKMIYLAMQQLMEKRVVLMVTHRMTASLEYDRIVEMK